MVVANDTVLIFYLILHVSRCVVQAGESAPKAEVAAPAPAVAAAVDDMFADTAITVEPPAEGKFSSPLLLPFLSSISTENPDYRNKCLLVARGLRGIYGSIYDFANKPKLELVSHF